MSKDSSLEEYDYRDNFEQCLAVELPILKDQTFRCVLLSHFQWAYWSLIMMPLDNIEACENFHLEYAKARMDLYFK